MTRRHRVHEVMCQCNRCHDIFTVTLQNRRGEVTIENCAQARQAASGLTHRPGWCGGSVSLFGQIGERVMPATWDPLAVPV